MAAKTEEVRVSYKSDDYGNPVYARVCWSAQGNETAKPIALVFHGGGYLVGSADMIPKPQTDYLVKSGFLVVIPNYRLAPQVTPKEILKECEEAYDWATATLPGVMKSGQSIEVDNKRVVAMGHSVGGTLAFHIASTKPIKAATVFYPSLFHADVSTSAHKSTNVPPFGNAPDFEPTDEDWASIKPGSVQLSEASLAFPGEKPTPRNKWHMHISKHGEWLKSIVPDGDFDSIDPFTRLTGQWPPTMIVQGDADRVPGSGADLAQRAEKELKAAGVKEVQLELIPDAGHMFDLAGVGTFDLGDRWKSVVKGLDWLKSHA